MIDSHCHINLRHFEDDFELVLEHAFVDGVRAVMNIGFDPDTARETVALVQRYPFVYGVVGCHPHDAQRFDGAFDAQIREYLAHERIIGIGEIGLDFYRDLAPRDVQEDVFRKMIRLSREKSLPIVIHCRDAFEDVIRVLADEAPHHRGIFHAFSGSYDEAQRVVDMGFHVGIGGVATFRNAELSETLEKLPLDRIVLETDSPYLTPSPFRGKRNEPAYVAHVARTLAEIRGVTPADISRITDENFCMAMGLSPDRLPAPVYKVGPTLYIHTSLLSEERMAALHTYAAAAPEDAETLGEDAVDELVICDIDEPLVHMDRVISAARHGREKGWWVRVNTSGTGNQLAGRNIAGELSECVDEVVVPFYGTTANQHDRMGQLNIGDEGFEIMKDFVRCSVAAGIETTCEFIAAPRFKPEPCKELAKELGAKYDIRMYRS